MVLMKNNLEKPNEILFSKPKIINKEERERQNNKRNWFRGNFNSKIQRIGTYICPVDIIM